MKSVLVAVATVLVAGCSPSPEPADSISCYVANQMICFDISQPTSGQKDNLPVKCSSDSGDFEHPAKCPQSGFIGKCTFQAPDGLETDRYYTGVDPAYQQDFCETVALGTWSTAF